MGLFVFKSDNLTLLFLCCFSLLFLSCAFFCCHQGQHWLAFGSFLTPAISPVSRCSAQPGAFIYLHLQTPGLATALAGKTEVPARQGLGKGLLFNPLLYPHRMPCQVVSTCHSAFSPPPNMGFLLGPNDFESVS